MEQDSLFLNGLTGEVVTIKNPNYDVARQEWNRANQKFPLVIVYCEKKQDVVNAIIWARRHCIDIRIRSGGHHYEGYSSGDFVLVIDISRLNALRLEEKQHVIKIEAGAKNTEVYDFIGSNGYVFPGGTCPTVGVSGFTLGGGWGFFSRLYGLGCDSLLELELVDYEGRIIKANKNCNPDLFWACRGAGGGNFGVVVSMTFQLPKPTKTPITLIRFFYVNTTKAKQLEVMNIWQNWLPELDKRMTLVASFYNTEGEGLGIFATGFFYGSSKLAKKILQPFSKIEGFRMNLEESSFLEAVKKVEATYPPFEKFKSTGRFVQRSYTLDELENIVKLVESPPDGSIYAAISFYALGGAINNISKEETAFYFRDAKYIMGIQSVWVEDKYAKNNQEWVRERFEIIKNVTKGSYVNFPISNLKNFEKEYFGGNAQRLNQVNQKYDPFNVFRFPQGLK
ncbi:FAD-dependent oxidoreductase [Lysinibacillus fusiformis]|uniref:FAD-dependent oxidoreductase n=1 Tax=Lysinibacillus fusiformis TaxID=28031 RepID=UPI0000F3A870|nr:FAD-dependent oxidoreductase [Lysinibacillus fusiformis]EAZ84191.1 probable reticuline oxidase [Bacillus sp. B14905]MED4078838.1 FAD-dependent oxidoreductase [Lysinibacillus fusiformis]NOG26311.1 FAD-binding protein [Lysinibacillus fusiformis]PCD84849.1 FAD-linked oxidase [Lysinibacillus fusiformis]